MLFCSPTQLRLIFFLNFFKSLQIRAVVRALSSAPFLSTAAAPALGLCPACSRAGWEQL